MLDEFVKVQLANAKHEFRAWMAINVAMVVLLILSILGVL